MSEDLIMTLLHALADTGADDSAAWVECTCGVRIWGGDDREAFDAFKSHKRLAQLHGTFPVYLLPWRDG